jgi:hypothetical protein
MSSRYASIPGIWSAGTAASGPLSRSPASPFLGRFASATRPVSSYSMDAPDSPVVMSSSACPDFHQPQVSYDSSPDPDSRYSTYEELSQQIPQYDDRCPLSGHGSFASVRSSPPPAYSQYAPEAHSAPRHQYGCYADIPESTWEPDNTNAVEAPAQTSQSDQARTWGGINKRIKQTYDWTASVSRMAPSMVQTGTRASELVTSMISNVAKSGLPGRKHWWGNRNPSQAW